MTFRISTLEFGLARAAICSGALCAVGLFVGAANAQSALSTKVGMGYAGLGYSYDNDELGKGVDFLHGPQMDFGLELGLGPVFLVGMDVDLTIAESGAAVAGLTDFELGEFSDVLDNPAAQTINGSIFAGSALVGVHFGGYKPAVGVGYQRVETKDGDGDTLREFDCFTWVAKPVEFQVEATFNFSVEYEQTLPGCDVEASGLALSASLSF